VAEKIRARFEATAIDIGEETIRCTVSIGIARYPDQGDTLKEVIALADTALYRAKHSGRNRIVVFNEEGEAPAPESVGPPPNPDDRPA
jgi:diguanylate cyclase (GGDEF)-like protein